MTTFVLVHGAWGGAHGFGKVRRLLQADGHEVFTPSLTGIGERAHLASPQVCLTTHIADVANAVLYEDLDDIVLLGFSYGGLVITGALEHIAGRISHLVYLDAFVPADGDSLQTLTAAAGPTAAIGPAPAGLCRQWTGISTTRPRLPGPLPAAPRNPQGASANRYGSPGRWRATPSPGPRSRPPPSPARSHPARSGPPRTGPRPHQPGATRNSTPPT